MSKVSKPEPNKSAKSLDLGMDPLIELFMVEELWPRSHDGRTLGINKVAPAAIEPPSRTPRPRLAPPRDFQSVRPSAIEDALDDGLPRAYSKDLYETKCSAVFEHVYESYQGEGKSVYTAGVGLR